MRRGWIPCLLACLILSYTVLFSAVVYLKYRSFSFHDFDLAIVNQTEWNTLHGTLVGSDPGKATIFNGGHVFLILFVVLPVYALFTSPVTLLFLQALALGFGALPVYLLGRKLIKPSFGILFALCYLTYPALNWVTLYEFHPIAFATPLILLVFYFYLERRWWPFLLCVVLSLSCREDVALPVFAVGVFALLAGPRRERGKRAGELKWALLPLLSALIWFLLCVKFIQPHFRPEVLQDTESAKGGLAFYSWLGDSPAEIVQTLLFYPGTVWRGVVTGPKMTYLLHLFVPLAFAPLLSGGALVMPLISLAEGLLSQRFTHYSIHYQYSSIVTPLLFISSMYGVRNLLRREWIAGKEKYVFTIILFFALVSAKMLGPLYILPSRLREWRVTEEDRLRQKFVDRVPKRAPVLATFEFSPKLSMRPLLFYFYHVVASSRKPEFRADARAAQGQAQYALVDFNDPITFYEFFRHGNDADIRRFLIDGNWRLLETVNSIALFGRGRDQDLGLVGRASPGEAERPLTISPIPPLELSGYSLRRGKVMGERVLELDVYFKCLEKVTADLLLGARFTSREDPEYFFRQELYGPFRIYPSSRWQPGEVVVQHCSILVPPDAPPGGYDMSLALSLQTAGSRFDGRFFHREPGAITLDEGPSPPDPEKKGSLASWWRELWSPARFNLSTINSLQSPRFFGMPFIRGINVLAGAILLAAALLYFRTGRGRRAKIVSLAGLAMLILWALYDIRETYSLYGTAETIWRSYVRPPPGEKSFPGLGDFYRFVGLCRERIPKDGRYRFHPYPDWPYDCRVHYFLYPRRIRSATWNNVIEGDDIPYHVVYRNPAVRLDAASGRLRRVDSFISGPGRIVASFDEDSFIFLEDR